MKEANTPLNQSTSIPMELTDYSLNISYDEAEGISKELEETLKQTAIRAILHQISQNYREELENLLGKDNIDEFGQPHALREAVVPFELYEFICKNIIGMIPDIEIEITDGQESSEEEPKELENTDHTETGEDKE
jgi:hypothetical protein